MNPLVDECIMKEKKWQDEFKKLRSIALSCKLTEELKWGVPCYTFNGSNIVLIHGFKEYCAYLFFKGSLMSDNDNILIQQTSNVQAARQVRFTNLSEIIKLENKLKTYINEAIEIEKSGKKVSFKKAEEFKITDELKLKLEHDPKLKSAFYALTPGRQRAYLLYFAAPKQSKTRESRIDKHIQSSLDGKGLNDI